MCYSMFIYWFCVTDWVGMLQDGPLPVLFDKWVDVLEHVHLPVLFHRWVDV